MQTTLEKIKNKLVSLNTLQQRVAAEKNRGKKIVFTNGCFDILHLGHITYLAQAAEHGDILVIGLNSDASVRNQGKGDNRPVNPENARGMLLAALEFVDFVVLFEEQTPLAIIEAIVPDVLVKGGDYDADELDPHSKKYIVGSDCVRNNGGQVKTIDLVAGFSTTKTIEKMRK
jgi:rfaE bifunctional protein nucleotidyltransferase chain/domain